MVANIFWRDNFPEIIQSPINCGAVAMLVGLVIVPIVSAITPKPDQKLVVEAFACYDKNTAVDQIALTIFYHDSFTTFSFSLSSTDVASSKISPYYSQLSLTLTAFR